MLLVVVTLVTLFFGCVIFSALSAASAYWASWNKRGRSRPGEDEGGEAWELSHWTWYQVMNLWRSYEPPKEIQKDIEKIMKNADSGSLPLSDDIPSATTRRWSMTKATSFDLGDREPAPEEGKRENFLRLHEIGGRTSCPACFHQNDSQLGLSFSAYSACVWRVWDVVKDPRACFGLNVTGAESHEGKACAAGIILAGTARCWSIQRSRISPGSHKPTASLSVQSSPPIGRWTSSLCRRALDEKTSMKKAWNTRQPRACSSLFSHLGQMEGRNHETFEKEWNDKNEQWRKIFFFCPTQG